MKGHAVCKDCGAATTDNLKYEQFIVVGDSCADGLFVICFNCGSSNVEGDLDQEDNENL